MNWKNPAWKELHLRGSLLAKALSELGKMKASELVALRHACAQVSKTNCGWGAYLLAPMLEKEIAVEFRMRKVARERKRNASTATDRK